MPLGLKKYWTAKGTLKIRKKLKIDKNKRKFELTLEKRDMSPEIHGNDSTTMTGWMTGYRKADRKMEQIRKFQL
jgi:hypothetical protein